MTWIAATSWNIGLIMGAAQWPVLPAVGMMVGIITAYPLIRLLAPEAQPG
ncbi:MAG: hypothetical protein Q7R39_14740 [Dehalococcoidia bacterium]|nr:hypothetical protein [Dehalococcoidia bacterium]